jgi:radical SAM protein with 4Fe4S-binding SPASM domain
MQWPGYQPDRGIDVIYFPIKEMKYCESLFETISILSNGDVVPCCYDLKGEAVFGNVFHANILEIWKNTGYSEFRNNFRNGKYPSFCLKCNVVSPRYLIWKDRGQTKSD